MGAIFEKNKLKQDNLMKNKIIQYCIVIILFCLSCQSEADKRLDAALNIAGENKKELQKVLEHYKNDPEKLKAAHFLIEYMPGHGGYDTKITEIMRPVYDKHRNISEKYNWDNSLEWQKEIDSLWEKEETNIPIYRASIKQDVHTIQAKWLIKEIDLAFDAWKKNVYTRNSSFENFCRYTLPYRFQNGICLDNSREVFNRRHTEAFSNTAADFRTAVDSLFHYYRDIQHNKFSAASMPVYQTSTFEKIKRGLCDHKTWYNCLLLSSLGMAVSIDYVPAWGNRSGAHTWNALIIDGKTYPFEPFWENDIWKYKKIYNNKESDVSWGKFRLPKVFRHTYDYFPEGPINDKKVKKEDIPSVFQNIRKKDVSSQYFETTDIPLTLTEKIPDDTYYCYLCVYSKYEGWSPVQWGKIENGNKVVFKSMGKDIVYLPAFYKAGTIIPAAPLFLLSKKGEIEKFYLKEGKTDITIRRNDFAPKRKERDSIRMSSVGSCFIAYNNIRKRENDTLLSLTDSVSLWFNKYCLNNKKSYRYISYRPDSDTLGLCELIFYNPQGQALPIKSVKASNLISNMNENIQMIIDGLSGTGYQSVFKKDSNPNELIFDLGYPQVISSIVFIPYTKSYLNENIEYELFYWDKYDWKSGGILIGNNSFLTFKNIPTGTIYKVLEKNKKNERIFSYEKGIVYWL